MGALPMIATDQLVECQWVGDRGSVVFGAVLKGIVLFTGLENPLATSQLTSNR